MGHNDSPARPMVAITPIPTKRNGPFLQNEVAAQFTIILDLFVVQCTFVQLHQLQGQLQGGEGVRGRAERAFLDHCERLPSQKVTHLYLDVDLGILTSEQAPENLCGDCASAGASGLISPAC